jgi:hypothetical protein
MLEQARQKALSTIWKAREEDWRAAESFLKYSFWQDYRSGSQINVNTETNVAVVKTLTEEERMRLIAQRQSSKDRVNALQTSPRLSRPKSSRPIQNRNSPSRSRNREQHDPARTGRGARETKAESCPNEKKGESVSKRQYPEPPVMRSGMNTRSVLCLSTAKTNRKPKRLIRQF